MPKRLVSSHPLFAQFAQSPAARLRRRDLNSLSELPKWLLRPEKWSLWSLGCHQMSRDVKRCHKDLDFVGINGLEMLWLWHVTVLQCSSGWKLWTQKSPTCSGRILKVCWSSSCSYTFSIFQWHYIYIYIYIHTLRTKTRRNLRVWKIPELFWQNPGYFNPFWKYGLGTG